MFVILTNFWPQIVKNRKAILGSEYPSVYDATGNLIPDIPDYDPTSELVPLRPLQKAIRGDPRISGKICEG